MTTPTITLHVNELAYVVFSDVLYSVTADLAATEEGINDGAVRTIWDTANAGEYYYATQWLYQLITEHPAIKKGGALLWWKVDIIEWLWKVLVKQPLPNEKITRFDDRKLGGVVKNPPSYYMHCMNVEFKTPHKKSVNGLID